MALHEMALIRLFLRKSRSSDSLPRLMCVVIAFVVARPSSAMGQYLEVRVSVPLILCGRMASS